MIPQQRKAAIDKYLAAATVENAVAFNGDPSLVFFSLINLPKQNARGRMSAILDTFQVKLNADQHLRHTPPNFVWRQHLRILDPHGTVLDTYLYNSFGTLTFQTNRAMFPGQAGA
jgi:hypothetical protein